MKNPLIAIIGPTASGKTGLAIELAQKFGGEIISADSRAIYRGMDIGTAKPTAAERAKVPHHLLDLVNPGERFTVYQFQKLARVKIAEIRARGKIPFLVGGSGLYLYSILFDYDFDSDETARENVATANAAHAGNKSRARRAELIPNCVAVGIEVEKDVLLQRISNRFAEMLDAGFLDEVKNLVEKYGADCPQLKRNSYGEAQKFLRGEITRPELLARAKIVDWQLAKKQLTWFRQRKDEIKWLELDAANRYLTKILSAQ
jgi:tRNA dimethylallyltransferase